MRVVVEVVAVVVAVAGAIKGNLRKVTCGNCGLHPLFRSNMEESKFHIDQPHIAADIYYLSGEEGGRETPVTSGYRGQFHIRNSDWDCVQEFIDKKTCQPGESVKAYLKFATVHNIVPMAVGTPFQIREGLTVVGRGIITVIIDKSISEGLPITSLYRAIDQIIWLDWDPIGVNEYSDARDEYNSYLPRILRLVLANATQTAIAEYLFKIEIEHMGLPGDYPHCLKVADKLILTLG